MIDSRSELKTICYQKNDINHFNDNYCRFNDDYYSNRKKYSFSFNKIQKKKQIIMYQFICHTYFYIVF